jgi:hypothetical protein
MRERIAEVNAWAAYSLGAVLMGGAALETFVYVPNWLHDVPRSLEATRTFLAVRTPGDFFQFVAPLLVLTSLAGIAIAWPQRRVRTALVAGLVLMIVAEALTFLLVYPNFPILLAEDVMQRPAADLDAAADSMLRWGWTVRIPLMCASVFGCYLYAARTSTREAGRSTSQARY